MSVQLVLLQQDIVHLAVDAIVNAANEALLGGGGVDGAIHRAAGPGLLAECRALPELRPHVRCPTGEARITRGHALAARYVIHTVGPVWYGGDKGEPNLLGRCYRSCLQLADDWQLRSIAFPAISCGVFGYPPEAATRIAIETAQAYAIDAAGSLERIVFCAFNDAIAALYRHELAVRARMN